MASRYDNESYLRSLSKSRGDADRQISNTLSEIVRQRQVGQAQAGKTDEAAGSVFAQTKVQHQADRTNLGQSLQGLGLSADLVPDSQTMLHDILGRQQGAYGKASGLLQQGFAEQGTQRTGLAQNIGKEIRGDFDSKRAEYVSRRDAEERQKAHQRALEQQRQAAQRAAQAHQAKLQQQALAHSAQQAAAHRQWESQMAAYNRQREANLANAGNARDAYNQALKVYNKVQAAYQASQATAKRAAKQRTFSTAPKSYGR